MLEARKQPPGSSFINLSGEPVFLYNAPSSGQLIRAPPPWAGKMIDKDNPTSTEPRPKGKGNGRRKSRFDFGIFFSRLTLGFFVEASGRWKETNFAKVAGAIALALAAVATVISAVIKLITTLLS